MFGNFDCKNNLWFIIIAAVVIYFLFFDKDDCCKDPCELPPTCC